MSISNSEIPEFYCLLCHTPLKFDAIEQTVTAIECGKCHRLFCEQCAGDRGSPPKILCNGCYNLSKPKTFVTVLDFMKSSGKSGR